MFEARGEPASRPDRVLVLMQSDNNAALIAASLGPDFEVGFELTPSDRNGDGVDILLIDGFALHRHGEAIASLRRAQEPLYLPVLLLSDRDASDIRSPRLQGVVDDIVKRPLSRAELKLRVSSLMRARVLSRQMVDLEEHYRNERRVARRFQEAALPMDLPEISGLSLSSYYSAGQSVSTIGGDWYDALVLEDGRVVVTIGDVVGSGLEAAVAMAHIRQVARGVAHIHPDPRMMLDAANRNLNGEGKNGIATAFVGVIDTVTSECTFANAGHVPPLIRYPDGRVVELPSGDLPLGVATAVAEQHVVPFPPGAVLVLYTDGLVESEREIIRDWDRLHAWLERGDVLREPNPARTLFHYMVEGSAPDDVAILIVRRMGDDRCDAAWTFASNDEQEFRAVKSEICRRLSKLGYSEADCAIAEIVLTELVGNVVRYAPGTVEVFLEEKGRHPILHVLDRGPSFTYAPRLPSSVMSENGRGLFLVRELSREFNVTERDGGGSHARAAFNRS